MAIWDSACKVEDLLGPTGPIGSRTGSATLFDYLITRYSVKQAVLIPQSELGVSVDGTLETQSFDSHDVMCYVTVSMQTHFPR
jgi:hypothetical protein